MNRYFTAVLSVVALGFLVLTGCQSEPEDAASESADTATEDAATEGPAEWSYAGETGPANWASLDSDYATCAGPEQSPIDIVTEAADQETSTINLDYESVEGTLKDTGKVLQMDLGGGTVTIDGKAYDLIQFHFHTPSEHTIDGESYPAEVHLVHAAEDGMLAVIGVMFEEGEANEALSTLWSALPNMEDSASMTFDASSLFPEDGNTYTYDGSLTTPPCSEVVSWHVMATPVSISSEQLEALTTMHDNTNRPIQPLNDREIEVAQL